MNPLQDEAEALCFGCVYNPVNLPSHAYSVEDYEILRKKSCSYDHRPGDKHCLQTRKSSCSIVDLEQS